MSNCLDSKALVVSERGIEIAKSSIEAIHQTGIKHLHACILLYRENINQALEVLLQRRASTKTQYPGHWCFSAGGHCTEEDLFKSNTYPDLAAIVRETAEEIGVTMELKKLIQSVNSSLSGFLLKDQKGNSSKAEIRHFRRFDDELIVDYDSVNHPFTENPIFSVAYVSIPPNSPLEFNLSTDEVDELKWWGLNQLESPNILLTPWVKHFLSSIPKV